MGKRIMPLILAACLCLLVTGACSKELTQTAIADSDITTTTRPVTSDESIQVNPVDPLNIHYSIDQTIVELRNGQAESPVAPDSSMKIRTSVWGQPALGDLNDDKVDDAALILIHEPGGSGTFYYIVAATSDIKSNKFSGTNTILLGDRILPKGISISANRITVTYLDRQNDQPMSETPTVEIVKSFSIENGMLQVQNEPSGRGVASYSLDRNERTDGSNIFYPRITGFKGELLADYMNQSLKKVIDQFDNDDQYSNVAIDYEVTRMDDQVLSVVFKGSAEMKDVGKITILKSVNLDIGKSTNEINFTNILKDTDQAKSEIVHKLDEAAKQQGIVGGFEAEGVGIYFVDDNIVFYYMPLDDSAKEFVQLSIPLAEIEQYLNDDFGERPAS